MARNRATELGRNYVLILFFYWREVAPGGFFSLSATPGKRRQKACKPGSVPARTRVMAIHLGRPLPGASRDLPERQCGNPLAEPLDRGAPARRSYLVLLPVGFAVPSPSPETRCALTAPFHPCRRARNRKDPSQGRRFAFCGTFPGVAPAGRYPAPCFRGARTFLPRRGSRPGEGGHPAFWHPLE